MIGSAPNGLTIACAVVACALAACLGQAAARASSTEDAAAPSAGLAYEPSGARRKSCTVLAGPSRRWLSRGSSEYSRYSSSPTSRQRRALLAEYGTQLPPGTTRTQPQQGAAVAETPRPTAEGEAQQLLQRNSGAGGAPQNRSPFVGMPTLDYNSDRGIGAGAVLSYYVYAPRLQPYKALIFLKLYTSTRHIHDDELRVDVLRPLGLPLRFKSRLGALVTRTENFCGLELHDGDCAPQLAEAAVTNAGLRGAARDDAVQRYYLIRMRRIHGAATTEYILRDLPHRITVIGGWRGAYLMPGDLHNAAPYWPSLYSARHGEGERGLDSAGVGGLSFDNRDREAAPHQGYHVELSGRLSAPILGSQWRWRGLFAAAGFYLPLTQSGAWVLALRSLGDFIWGDISTVEMARSGSITSIIDQPRFGGHAIGRGIRERRYTGKLNLVQQVEIRGRGATLNIYGQSLEVGGALYFDAALIRPDVSGWQRLALADSIWGAGIGLRLLWNDTFALRFDTGVSPSEHYAPRLYVKVGNPF